MGFVEIVRHLYLGDRNSRLQRKQGQGTHRRGARKPENKKLLLGSLRGPPGAGRCDSSRFHRAGLYRPRSGISLSGPPAPGARLQHVGGMIVLQDLRQRSRQPAARMKRCPCSSNPLWGHDIDRRVRWRLLRYAQLGQHRRPGTQAYHDLAVDSFACRFIPIAVGRKFLLDVIPTNSPPLICISQADSSRIALIGRPLSLPAGALYISPDKLLTVSVEDPASVDAALGSRRRRALLQNTGSGIRGNPCWNWRCQANAAATGKENVTLYWRPAAGRQAGPDPHLA